MGLNEAKKYISELHKRQDDPFLWPDYLTGLPDSHAIIIKTKEAYSKLGRHAISYIRIANINSYLIKYGTDRHAEIIQWAAAILKITADKFNGFVGVTGSHDFVATCRKNDMEAFLEESGRLFEKKAKTFYQKNDLDRKTVISFRHGGQEVNVGFMKLVASTVSEKIDIPRGGLIPHLEQICRSIPVS